MRIYFVTAPLLALATIGCGTSAGPDQSSASDLSGTETTSTFVPASLDPTSTVALDPSADQVVGLWRFSAIEGPDDASLETNLTEGSVEFDLTSELGLSINVRTGTCSEFAGGIDIDAGQLTITSAYERTLEECSAASGPVPVVTATLACLRNGCGYAVANGELRLDLDDGQAVLTSVTSDQ